jgi:hypothetical protein
MRWRPQCDRDFVEQIRCAVHVDRVPQKAMAVPMNRAVGDQVDFEAGISVDTASPQLERDLFDCL